MLLGAFTASVTHGARWLGVLQDEGREPGSARAPTYVNRFIDAPTEITELVREIVDWAVEVAIGRLGAWSTTGM
jgi:hypothetical protein